MVVEPVKPTMSTSGDAASASPTRWSDDVTKLTTPAGMSVLVISSPRRSELSGVSGAGLKTTVLPVAMIGPSFDSVISIGKFHGTIAPITPTGFLTTVRRYAPVGPSSTPRSISHS